MSFGGVTFILWTVTVFLCGAWCAVLTIDLINKLKECDDECDD